MKPTEDDSAAHARPIIYIDLRESQKADEGATPLVKDLRRLDRSSSAAAERLAKAVLKGVRRYRKERKSVHHGDRAAITQIPLHVARGMVTSLEQIDGLAQDAEDALPAPKLRAKIAKRLRR